MKDAMVLDKAEAEPVELPAIKDYYKWAFEQAEHLRAHRFDLIDLPNIIDEIETVGRSEYHGFRSALKIVLTHMLKWDYQPHKRSVSWEFSIDEHRDQALAALEDSPSMISKRDEAVTLAYGFARKKASRETRMKLTSFSPDCPYSWSDIMDKPYELEERS